MITHLYPDHCVFSYSDINIEKFDFIKFLAKNVFLVHCGQWVRGYFYFRRLSLLTITFLF